MRSVLLYIRTYVGGLAISLYTHTCMDSICAYVCTYYVYVCMHMLVSVVKGCMLEHSPLHAG